MDAVAIAPVETTPATVPAAVASTAAAAALMKNDRRCFNVPPGVRLTAVVVDGLPQPIGKRRRRAPTEHPVGLCAVEREPANITGAPLAAEWFDAHSHQLADLSKDGVDRDLATAGDVEGLPITSIDGPHVRGRDVADVDVILG